MKNIDGKIEITPQFVSSESDLHASLNWNTRDAIIRDIDGNTIFEQKDVEFPGFWSDIAVSVVADKYFRINNGEREKSLKELVDRVVNTITEWGIELGYFDEENAEKFNLDLKYIIYNQYYAFNSPVWFNVGIDENPQVSACFIQGVEDDMKSIMELAYNEAMIFKHGSGSGTNFSKLRSQNETLTGGGKASGPVSFMKGFDSFSGVIKSGGKTRRAAKMAILDDSHPDIIKFVESKYIEELKARSLVASGYNPDFNDEYGAYSSVAFQNENHAVQTQDAFMRRVKEDGEWSFYTVKDGYFIRKQSAREIFTRFCECAHFCGDPGLQFTDTINAFHTTPNSGKIRGSNPCSEFLNIDDSACNLGSINLMRLIYVSPTNGYNFDIESFIAICKLVTLAQEILVDKASYPTERIHNVVVDHRQLGIGYCNIGTLLMYCGVPYDSDEGRSIAASISSLMTATVYYTSAVIASVLGPFKAYKDNEEAMQSVLAKHLKYCEEIEASNQSEEIRSSAEEMWENALYLGSQYGYRNSQATLLAPTGTIGIMMDCDTTGVEPETAIVKYKTLVGGGSIKMVNKNIGHALKNMGYSNSIISKILEYLHNNEEIEKCPLLRREHLPVFDCALGTNKTARVIRPQGHVKMLAAIQPHISGGISKTVNMPSSSTVKDIYDIFMLAFDLGVKCITIYRDGSKSSQPLNVKKIEKEKSTSIVKVSSKRTMPNERRSITHKFSIGGVYKGYLTIGFYPDGTPGEIFIESAKGGSTMNGLLDGFATMVSIGLQHGVPLEKIVSKFAHVSFQPDGFSENPDIGYARSIIDYIARYLEKFIKTVKITEDTEVPFAKEPPLKDITFSSDAPPCSRCGSIMIRNGSCFKCNVCGDTSGCS